MKIRGQFQKATLLLLVVAIALGVFLRFTNLAVRMPTHDEVFTALRISGYKEAELVTDLAQTRPVSVAYLQKKYQLPNSSKTLGESITGLAQEEPQLTPLYYATVKLWAQVFNGSISSLRLWSALISVVALPCIYWLCLTLFKAHLTASIATVLLAVSPFHLMYAQDTRHYSLWTVGILLSSAALLQARRLDSWRGWMTYALGFAFSLYAGLLTLIVGMGHFIYSIVLEKCRPTRLLIFHGLALVTGLAAFSPWVAVVFTNLSQVRKMSGQLAPEKLGLLTLARAWIRQPGRLLYDLNLPNDTSWVENLLQYAVTGCGLVFILYAFYVLCRTTDREVWLFVLTLVGTTAIGLAVQDLTLGGHAATGGMSNIPKYLTPCSIAIILAIAHLFAHQLTHHFAHRPVWQNRVWQVIFAGFIMTQLCNSLVIWSSPIASINGRLSDIQANLAAIQVINQSEDNLLVTESSAWDVMYFSQKLNPNTQILTRPSCISCNLAVEAQGFVPDRRQNLDNYQHIFLFPHPSESLLSWAKQQSAFRLSETPLPNSARTLVRLDRR
jgi:uncharacterized membrane protein